MSDAIPGLTPEQMNKIEIERALSRRDRPFGELLEEVREIAKRYAEWEAACQSSIPERYLIR